MLTASFSFETEWKSLGHSWNFIETSLNLPDKNLRQIATKDTAWSSCKKLLLNKTRLKKLITGIAVHGLPFQ